MEDFRKGGYPQFQIPNFPPRGGTRLAEKIRQTAFDPFSNCPCTNEMTDTLSHTIAQKNEKKNINCNKFPKYASLLSLWSISARERSSVDPHSELIESYLATCTCFISDRYLPKRTNVQEHIVSLISPVCKHLPWQPLGHQPPETWAPIQSTEP